MSKKKIAFIFLLLVVIIGVHFISMGIIDSYIKQNIIKDAEIVSNKKVTQFYINILDNQEIVRSLSNNSLFKKYITSKVYDCEEDVEEMFITIAQPNRYLFQLRYLDINGQEVIRVNKTKENNAYLVKQDELQNKKSRYYFEESVVLPKNKIWFSKIDLNIEHGKVEKPIRPTLRIATPAYDHNNKVKGIVIANIAIKHFLHRISKGTQFDLFLVDSNGDYLYHKNPKYSWSKYLGNQYNLFHELPTLKKEDFTQDKFAINYHLFQKIPMDSKEEIYLVLTPKEEFLTALENSYKTTILSYVILLFVVIGLMAYLFYSIKSKRQEEQLIQSQKMASLGEMIANIAHQWRQPLSVISTASTGMKLKSELQLLEKEEISKTCDTINHSAQYLSKTIDDFRNFINQDKKKTLFNLTDIIEHFLSLSENSIKTHNIEIIQDIDKSIKINGYDNELVQCFINIFNNSKDAEKEKPKQKHLFFIKTYRANGQIYIKLKDNGGGIPENIMENIFDPYFTTKHKSQGTGIGLYMTYNIVKNMGGKIEAVNTQFSYKNEQYSGAEFIITFPVEA